MLDNRTRFGSDPAIGTLRRFGFTKKGGACPQWTILFEQDEGGVPVLTERPEDQTHLHENREEKKYERATLQILAEAAAA
jgi:hypothetical protein